MLPSAQALRSHLLLTVHVLPSVPLLPALLARPPDPSRLLLPVTTCHQPLHPSLPGQTSSAPDPSWTSSTGVHHVLAALPPPCFAVWVNHFSGYVRGRVPMINHVPHGPWSQGFILSPVPSAPLWDSIGPEGSGFGWGGICIAQDRDCLLPSSAQALRRRCYLTFHSIQCFCPIMIFLHGLHLFS